MIVISTLILRDLITARKRNLEQGNVFTPVRHSVHGGDLCPSMHHRSHDRGVSRGEGSVSRWESLSRGYLSRGSPSGEFLSGGDHLCPDLWGFLSGGLCPGGSLSGRPPDRDPPYGNERAVRILLECILVINS